jgi:hypothetical protein
MPRHRQSKRSDSGQQGPARHLFPVAAACGLVLAVAGSGCSSDDNNAAAGTHISTAQLVRYQERDDPGPHPFTGRVDVPGKYRVRVFSSAATAGAVAGGGAAGGGAGSSGGGTSASGPGGSNSGGSNPGTSNPGTSGPGTSGPGKWRKPRVCNRYALAKNLKSHPGRTRAWARILGLKPKYSEVRAYIRRLHPITLTRDTLVTAHTVVGGQPTAQLTILQAGTPALADYNGRPVINCTCGNPLTKPIASPPVAPTPGPRCFNCPAHTRLLPQCPFWAHAYNFDGKLYHGTYDPDKYDDIFVRYANKSKSFPFASCYVADPRPPLALPFTLYEQVIVPAKPAPTYTAPVQPVQPEEPQTETTTPDQPHEGEGETTPPADYCGGSSPPPGCP